MYRSMREIVQFLGKYQVSSNLTGEIDHEVWRAAVGPLLSLLSETVLPRVRHKAFLFERLIPDQHSGQSFRVASGCRESIQCSVGRDQHRRRHRSGSLLLIE